MIQFLKDWWNGRRPGDPNPAALNDPASKINAIDVSARVVTRRRVLLVACAVFLFLFLSGGWNH